MRLAIFQLFCIGFCNSKKLSIADELGSGVRNLYKYVHLYLGTDPVFDEEDVFKQTIPLDDDYSPEPGKISRKFIGGLRNNPQITIVFHYGNKVNALNEVIQLIA